MKSFLVILLLANIGFFLWAKQYPVATQLPQPEVEIGPQRILLISEQQREDSSSEEKRVDQQTNGSRYDQPNDADDVLSEDRIEEQTEGLMANTEEPPQATIAQTDFSLIKDRCFTVGVFESEEIVESLKENFLNAGITATVRSVDLREPKSYWIYLPPMDNYAAAREVSRTLQSKRVKDYFIVRDKNEWENAISLGLYSKLDQVDRRVAQLKRKDIEPEVQTRYREYQEYWVDYILEPGQGLPEFLSNRLESDTALTKQALECNEV